MNQGPSKPLDRKAGVSRQLGTTVRVIAVVLGTLSILCSLLLCFALGPSGLALLIVGVPFLLAGITGSPRIRPMLFASWDAEWDRDIVDGVSPDTKYLKYTRLDYLLLATMICVGLITIPLWDRLIALGVAEGDWTITAGGLLLSISVGAYGWQTKQMGLVGAGMWLFILILGLGVVVLQITQHARLSFGPFIFIYLGFWSALRAWLIQRYHIKPQSADR